MPELLGWIWFRLETRVCHISLPKSWRLWQVLQLEVCQLFPYLWWPHTILDCWRQKLDYCALIFVLGHATHAKYLFSQEIVWLNCSQIAKCQCRALVQRSSSGLERFPWLVASLSISPSIHLQSHLFRSSLKPNSSHPELIYSVVARSVAWL